MSDNLEDFETDTTDGSKLRKQLEAALKKNRDLETQVENFSKAERERQVNGVLGDKGFKNPKRVSRDLLADNIDPADTTAVEKWLEENGDDYAKATQSTEEPKPEAQQQTQQEQEPVQSAVPQEIVDSYQRLSNISQAANPQHASALDQVRQEVTKDMTREQVLEKLKAQGI